MFGHDNNQPAQDDQSKTVAPEAANDATLKAPTLPAVGDTSAPSLPSVTSAPSASSVGTGDADELLSIKQEALQQLSPLVNHLEQSPEEKFRTTMMMIQASDNQGLIKVAYDAAKDISDEKTRAQALLDIVNEINYFTQQHKD